MNKTAIILGLGPSHKLFTQNKAVQEHFKNAAVFGVNDIWKYYPTPHLLVLDQPGKFEPERLQTILQSKPDHFYLWNNDLWPTMPNREYLGPITEFQGDLSLPNLQKPKVISSTWVAAQCAWLKGYRHIILFGADYTHHPAFSMQQAEIAKGYFYLAKAMEQQGGKLNIGINTCEILTGFVKPYPL